MSGVQIRSFRESDAESAKEIFTLGMSEHVPSSFVHLLKQPLPQLVVMVTFCALVTSSKSLLLPVLAVTLLLAAARHAVARMFSRYIEVSMKQDVGHISEVYLQRNHSHFWVAEVEGRVVGTVACLPADHAPGCLELKRLSVRRSHRGMGVAKALCRAVSGFASQRGFAAVVLFTSVVQTDAQKLYENMGYKRVREFAAPELIAKVTNFMLFEYRLDLEQEK